MNNGMKSVISAAFALRTLPRVWNLSRNTIPSNWLQATVSPGFRYKTHKNDNSSSILKLKSKIPNNPSKTWDNIEEVFQYIDISSNLKSPANLISVMKDIMTISKQHGLNVENIKRRGEFIKFCQILRTSIPKFMKSQTLVTLTFLNEMQVPSSATISQLCFENLRKNINNLSLKEICIVQSLLKERGKTHLTAALYKALPLAMGTQLDKQLDRTNLVEMTTLLNYVVDYSRNLKTVGTLLSAIQDHGELTERTCYAVLRTISKLSLSSKQYEKLIHSCLEYISRHIEKLIFPHMINLSKRFSENRNPLNNFYHEAFWDNCGSRIVNRDCGMKRALTFLLFCGKKNHIHIPILDYIAAKCFENPLAIMEIQPALVALYIAELAKADYKPVFWDMIQENVIKSSRKVEFLKKYSLVRHATYLLTLDHYCPEVIARAFTETSRDLNEETLPSYLVKRDLFFRAMLHQIVKTLYPLYTGPWPNCENQKCTSYELDTAFQACLVKALGGAQYIKTNMRTKTGCTIEYVVVLRKGGYPVAINTEECSESNSETSSEESSSNTEETLQNDDTGACIEDMEVPPQSQILLIFQMRQFAYPNNMNRLKGFISLLHKSLEAMGDCYSVIPINFVKWSAMPDREKVPYLMQAIRLKSDEMSYTPHAN